MSTLTVTTSPSSYDSFHEHLSPPSTAYGFHSSSAPRGVGEGPEPKSSNNDHQPQFQSQSLGNSKDVDDENENGIDIHISNDIDIDIDIDTRTARTNNGVAFESVGESDNDREEEPHGDMVSLNDDESEATPNSSIQRTSRKRHSVRFSTAEFRYYPITVGDNPSVTSGVPLTIGWDHWKEATLVVPFDQHREDGGGDFEKIRENKEECDREGDPRTGRDVDDAREESNTRDRREADRTAAGPGAGYPTARARRRAILPAHQQPCPFRCFRARAHRPSGPRLRDPAERATLLMQTGHTRQELLRALHETTRSRNRLLRTAREQRVLPRLVLAVLDWIHEVGESCPRPCPGTGGVRWCGPSRGTEGEDGDGECGSENQSERGGGRERSPEGKEDRECSGDRSRGC